MQPSKYAPDVGGVRCDNPGSASDRAAKWWIAVGMFLFVLGIYVLTSPGRIDIVDGQARFDVAYNWLVNGRPIIKDSWIGPFMGVPGRDGLRYAYYGAPGSIFAMPLVGLGLLTSAPAIQPSQFLFSLTSSIFGAAIAPILFLFYLELGVTTRKALVWTLVSSFATYLWPISNSTFDNAQHALFAVTSVYLGFLSARRKSVAYALAGGSMAGVLFLYQEYFLLIVPALALSVLELPTGNTGTLATPKSTIRRLFSAIKRPLNQARDLVRAAWSGPGEGRSSCIRYVLFLAAVGVGVILSFAYNDLRFGSWLENGKVKSITANAYPLFGNPLPGFLTLLASPGKSIFLYSPTIVLAILGMRFFWKRQPEIALAVVLSTLPLIAFLSCICFVGGDWCWGPRYLTPLLPLWALTLPFIQLNRFRRRLVALILGVSFVVQIMALSVENQRFFFQSGFRDYFWAEDAWVYFKHSALLARVDELLSLSAGPPPTAKFFNSIPLPDWSTYTLLGPPPTLDRSLAPTWMRNYQIYYLPRPWPLWISYRPEQLRPINRNAWLLGLLGMSGLGVGLVILGIQRREYQ